MTAGPEERQPARRVLADRDVFDEARGELARAERVHGDYAMTGGGQDDGGRLAVLTEEVGEVARCLNEMRLLPVPPSSRDEPSAAPLWEAYLDRQRDLRYQVRAELVQVAAMAAGWASVVDLDS